MKPYTIHHSYKFLAFAILGAVALVSYRAEPDLFKTPSAESATLVDITGYAWANTPQSAGAPETGTNQGLGWISMNGTNYGVSLDTDTGNFSGYAWVGNGDDGAGSTGWVDFAPTSGYPGAPFHGVKKEGNTLTGWAKVLSLNSENSNNGWIKMSKDASDGDVDYGVTIDPSTGRFSGYAWGSDVIGWVDFAPATAAASGDEVHIVTIACTSDKVVSWGSCTGDDPAFCSSNPSGTPIPGTQLGTCGIGYSGYASQSCNTGKTCGGSCSGDADCDGGETCLLGTLRCGSAETGCGNGTCNAGETLLTCPQDCKGKVQQF